MYKNIIRGIINKKTGRALTISHGVIFTYYYENNRHIPHGVIDFDCQSSPVKVSIKEYLQ